jgi:hypothetical protein
VITPSKPFIFVTAFSKPSLENPFSGKRLLEDKRWGCLTYLRWSDIKTSNLLRRKK